MRFKSFIKTLTVVGPGRPLKSVVQTTEDDFGRGNVDSTSFDLFVVTANGIEISMPFLEFAKTKKNNDLVFRYQLQSVQHWKRFVPKVEITTTKYPIYGPLYLKAKIISKENNNENVISECQSNPFFVICKSIGGSNSDKELKSILEKGLNMNIETQPDNTRKRKRTEETNQEINTRSTRGSKTEKQIEENSTISQSDFQSKQNNKRINLVWFWN